MYDVRYFAPLQEVPFCGHATIAAAVALSEREPMDVMVFYTPAGLVSINTEHDQAWSGGRADHRRPAGGHPAGRIGAGQPGGAALVRR